MALLKFSLGTYSPKAGMQLTLVNLLHCEEAKMGNIKPSIMMIILRVIALLIFSFYSSSSSEGLHHIFCSDLFGQCNEFIHRGITHGRSRASTQGDFSVSIHAGLHCGIVTVCAIIDAFQGL